MARIFRLNFPAMQSSASVVCRFDNLKMARISGLFFKMFKFHLLTGQWVDAEQTRWPIARIQRIGKAASGAKVRVRRIDLHGT